MLGLVVAAACRKPPHAPVPEPAQPPIAEAPLAPTGSAELQIGSVQSKPSADGTDLYVEGTVRNVGTRASRPVIVWVDGLDESGLRLSRAETVPTPPEIPAGGAASFVVRLPNDRAIRTFDVRAIGK